MAIKFNLIIAQVTFQLHPSHKLLACRANVNPPAALLSVNPAEEHNSHTANTDTSKHTLSKSKREVNEK